MSANNQQIVNNANVKLPEWLKVELFEKLLKDTLTDFKAIKEFKAVPGTKPGDNYATVMLRIEIDVQLKDNTTKCITYMLKLPHVSDAYQETFGKNKFSIFDMERDMFRIYVEEFKQLYRDVGLEVEFGAKCYKLDTPHEHVLLEDLRPRGFQSVNRQDGLDEEHTLTLLTKLAQWHAASAVRVATIGPYPTHMSQGLLNDDGKFLISKMTDEIIPYVLKALQTIEGHEVYYDDIKKLEGKIMDSILDIAAVDHNEFNVLNHGDCWVSNMMFRYDQDTGKLLDSYLVDYQMSVYGSPAFDLLYFLISSTKLALKVNKFDYFIKQYYDQLIKHLQLLNYTKKLPSLIDIHTQLLKKGIWGYWTAFGVMAGCALEPTETASFDNLLSDTPEGDAFRTLLFSGKAYKEQLKIVLPWLQNRGAFQVKHK